MEKTAAKPVQKHKPTIKFLSSCILATVITITILETSEDIRLSWGIVSIGICYALWHVIRQGHKWWERKGSQTARHERFLKLLAGIMGFFLATGCALFLKAFQYETEPGNGQSLFVNAEYLLRSLACSLDLFMLDIDCNVLDAIKEHAMLKGFISVQAILSFSCTVAVLISLVYARIMAYMKLHKLTKIDNEHNHIYLFFNMNEPSRLLAKSIKEKEGEQAVIIIVENCKIDEEDRGGWNSIVGLVTNRKQTFVNAEELDARITFTESRLCDIKTEQMQAPDIFSEMNLMKICELIRKLDSANGAELHVFFMSEDEDENVHSLAALASDKTINDLNGKIKQRFYCHARRNGLNRVVEDIAVKRGMEVRIIDSSYIAIELLKTNDLYHPVRLVDIDKKNPGTVSSEFNSMIVGFDEVGQDAMRFIYEFGAFVDNTSTDDNVKRSPFRCTVIDLQMKQLSGMFEAFAPAAMNNKNSDGTPLIRMIECDCKSGEFYNDILKPECGKLNYVVVAVGDDELGMQCAIRIFNYVRRCREDLRHFRIFVRSYNADKEAYMKQIAAHYNEGYNTDCTACRKGEYRTEQIIIPFGQIELIYSYDMVINEELTLKGKRFQEGYARMKNDPELWDIRRDILLGAKRYEKDMSGNKYAVDVPMGERSISINNIRSLRRKESQDLANALHAGTKIYLLRRTLGEDYDWNDFIYRYFDGEGNKPLCEGHYDRTIYPGLTQMENRTILNLARLEHLRWNASHEMLGYEQAEHGLHCCDERKKQHNCLRPWHELDEEAKIVTKTEKWDADYKSFDFGVVDNTLLLYKDMLLSQL